MQSVKRDAKLQNVFNFEVEEYHTYFVGKSGAWVHDACVGPTQPRGANTLYDADGHVMVTHVDGLPKKVTVSGGLADIETAGGKYYVKASDGNYYEVVRSTDGTWSNTPSSSAAASNIPSATDFYSSLDGLAPNDRIAQINTVTRDVAIATGWVKSSELSALNNRTVYVAQDGTLYAVDTAHGIFEVTNSRGIWQQEVRIDLTAVPKAGAEPGTHDLRVK